MSLPNGRVYEIKRFTDNPYTFEEVRVMTPHHFRAGSWFVECHNRGRDDDVYVRNPDYNTWTLPHYSRSPATGVESTMSSRDINISDFHDSRDDHGRTHRRQEAQVQMRLSGLRPGIPSACETRHASADPYRDQAVQVHSRELQGGVRSGRRFANSRKDPQ